MSPKMTYLSSEKGGTTAEQSTSGRGETESSPLPDLCSPQPPSSERDRDVFLEIYLRLLGMYSDWTETRCNGKCIPSQTDGESFNTADY